MGIILVADYEVGIADDFFHLLKFLVKNVASSNIETKCFFVAI